MARLGCLRPVWSLLKALLLISLPVTFFPFLNGLMEGAFAAKYMKQNEFEVARYFLQELEAKQLAEYISVPGVPSVVDAALPPFHVVRLQDPTNWWEKLGLERPEFDKEVYPPYGTHDPYKLPSLHDLYRRASMSEESGPWHHWVYASAQHRHFEGRMVNEWDKAFEDLIQYHYANNSVESAGFHYVSCPYSFLCASWRVKGPALLHFTTEDPDAEKVSLTAKEKGYPGYDAITVRIIEFPLKERGELALPGVFPSYFNQLRAVTATSSAWSIHTPYSDLDQLILRVADVCEDAAIAHPRTYGLLIKCEDVVMRLLGFENAVTPMLARLVAVFLSGGARLAGYKIMHETARLLGYTEIEGPETSEKEDETKIMLEQLGEILADLTHENGKPVSKGAETWGVVDAACQAGEEEPADTTNPS
ncbi:hypothetical protein AK830_g4087 [Neonectria ditissima]|uniref:Uncharacterized protein n=1 Tax=Neonectria ditissima TaxID=78410 RepID=A0A0P7B7C0_9HYPO|nr:hypothetical protein AK830_g4087 [Neonectria ditissima]